MLTLLLACAGPEERPEPIVELPPDLVLITLDTTRADRIGAYGDPLARTPHLDALATRSVLYREAWTPVPSTLPAHASMLTGRLPSEHGLRDNAGDRLSPKIPVITESLQQAGYHTGAFVSAYVLDSTWGLDRGFDRYYDDFHPEDIAGAAAFGDVSRKGRETVSEARRWWEATPSPRFLWIHLFEPHRPYQPSGDWVGDPYRGEIFELDRALGPLLTTVGEEAVVIVAGDHGENLWDGGEIEHGLLLTRSALRVPLLVRPADSILPNEPRVRDLPKRPVGWEPVPGLSGDGLDLTATPDAPIALRTVETPVSLIDIAATLADAAGLSWPQGQSLLAEPTPRPVYSETLYPLLHYGWEPSSSVRTADRWLVDGELYNPREDPWAQRPLREAPPDEFTVLVAAQSGIPAALAGPDLETSQRLVALGYAVAVVDHPTGDRPYAADRVGLLHRVARAQSRMESAPQSAEEELLSVLEEDGGLIDAWFSLGTLRLKQNDADGALAAYAELLQRAPNHQLALNNTVVILRALRRDPEALAVVNALIAQHPADARWHRLRVNLLGRQEQPDAVAAAAKQGISVAPDDPYLHYMLGLANLQLGQHELALASLAEARNQGSRAPDLSMWEGKIQSEQGNIDAAVEAWRRAASDMPTDVRPVVAAGLLLSENDRCAEALPFLLTAMERGTRDGLIVAAYRRCGGL